MKIENLGGSRDNHQTKMSNNVDILAEIENHNIPKTDCVGNFSIYCSKEPKDCFSKSIRGVIFENNKVIHKGFPYSEDVDVDDTERLRVLCSDFRACLSHEGTVIKMLYFGEQWNMTTHRRLDATKSRWGSSKSFGDIFKDCLKKYFETYCDFLSCLDKKKHYHFLLKSTPTTRIVVKPDGDEPILLTAISCAETFEVLPLQPIANIPIAKSLEFSDAAAIAEFVKDCDPFYAQGVIFFSQDMKQTFRVANTNYLKYVSVRDNIASLPLAYACIRQKEEEKKLFFELYDEAKNISENFEKRFEIIAQDLHRSYIDRFVHKRHFRVSQQRHAILNALHTSYLKKKRTQTETHPKILVADVRQTLNEQRPILLHRLIKGRETFVASN
jgi:hypothetical protein